MTTGATRLTGWRRIANAIWQAPNDPQIFGSMELDASRAIAFIEAARAAGHHVTLTHVAGRALAHALEEAPDLNVRIRHGRAIPRPSVDIFFITAVASGRDLSGVKVARTNEKPAIAVATEVAERSHALKSGHDPDLARTKAIMERLPMPLLKVAMRAATYIVGERAQSLPLLGLHASPFGSAMISSVGMLGLPMAFSPLVWMYKVPLLLLIGEVTPKPVAVDGHVEIRPMLPVTATIDHRFVDGFHVSRALHAFRKYFADPFAHEPSLGDALSPSAKSEHVHVASPPRPNGRPAPVRH
jgi:pyruvate dehydrogenase E2 component (dihydrolipoamide acetyltransferase)